MEAPWCNEKDFDKAFTLAKQEQIKYTDTVNALFALGIYLLSDTSLENLIPNCRLTFGKTMSRKNAPAVTPDLFAQRDNQYGVLGEAKPNANIEEKQLNSYCENLEGWFTNNKRIPFHDVVFLVPVEFADSAKRTITEKFNLPKEVVVISYITADFQIVLRKECGKFYLPDYFPKNPVVGIPLEILKKHNYNNFPLFYDGDPIPPYTMSILWDHVFTLLAQREEHDPHLGCKILNVEANELTKHLQTYYGPRSIVPQKEKQHIRDIPKKKWIKDALDEFLKIGRATQDERDKDRYRIRYTIIRGEKGDSFKFFVKKCWEVRNGKVTKGQIKQARIPKVDKKAAERQRQQGFWLQ